MINKLAHFIHSNFLILLLTSYLLATFAPQFGLFLRHINFGVISWPDGSTLKVSLSVVMLSMLLFNAGFGFKINELKSLKKQPGIILTGFLANLLTPLLLVYVIHFLILNWHNFDELQNLLVGLALVASMPIAGSSTAWAQNSDGNLSLSLGLVILSTFASPITTPLILKCFGFFTTGEYSQSLFELSKHGTNAFLILAVVIPSILGILVKLSQKQANSSKAGSSAVKLLNLINLLLLNYSNASLSLPGTIAKPDWDYYILILLVTSVLCLVAFAIGYLIAKLFKSPKADMASLMFGLGMNNNGTGLVLASLVLSNRPNVMLPLIFYTLVQQIIAAIIDKYYLNKIA